jgi:hypothetical protein
MWKRLLHDVELKRQIVTVSMVATIITVFEAVLFFGIISPQVKDQLQDMLRRDQKSLQGDELAQSILRCVMATAHEREVYLLNRNNRGALVHTVLVIALPLVIIATLCLSSGPLRRSPWKPIFLDVSITVFGIGAFQICFYFLGKQWWYASLDSMAADVCTGYRKATKDTKVSRCDGCPSQAKEMVRSHLLPKDLPFDPAKWSNVTMGDLFQMVQQPWPVSEVAAHKLGSIGK